MCTGDIIYENRLFSVFKEYYKDNKLNATQQMQQFKAYSDIYRKFDNYPSDSKKGIFFYRLGKMDTTTVYPLLLEVFKTQSAPEKEEELLNIINDIESFLVRRMICGLPSKNYNKFFTEMIHVAKESEDLSLSTIRNYLLKQSSETSKWPDDDEFRKAWMELPFYSRLRTSKTKLILEAIELEMHEEKTEIRVITGPLTIEHIMPQKWEENWPLAYDSNVAGAKEKAEMDRRRAIQRIGNLTLLTKELNPAISNSAWENKKSQVIRYSILNLNKYAIEKNEWDEESIDERTMELYEIAKRIWPRPSKEQ